MFYWIATHPEPNYNHIGHILLQKYFYTLLKSLVNIFIGPYYV